MGDILELIHGLSGGLESDEATSVKAGQALAGQLFSREFPDISDPDAAGPLWAGLLTHIADEAYHRAEHLSDENKAMLDEVTSNLIETAQRVFHADGETCAKDEAFRLMVAAYYIGVFAKPQKDIVLREKAAEMRAGRLQKAADRRALLADKPYVEEVAASRKSAEALESDYAETCQLAGEEPVSARQLQRDAQDILKERRESSGHT